MRQKASEPGKYTSLAPTKVPRAGLFGHLSVLLMAQPELVEPQSDPSSHWMPSGSLANVLQLPFSS